MKKKREILSLEKALLKLNKVCTSIDFIQIKIASPERIKSWATRILNNKEIKGEILITGTINFRILTTDFGGLFCQRIFGPIKDKVCACLENKGNFINKICANCEVELIEARVRRYRMGYIELIHPVSHIWYLQGEPSYLVDILGCYRDLTDVVKEEYPYLSFSDLKKIIYSTEPLSNLIDKSHPLYEIYNNLNSFNKKVLKINSNLKYSTRERYSIIRNRTLSCRKKITKTSKSSAVEVIKVALEALNINFEINKARDRAMNQVAANKISIEKNYSKKTLFFSEAKQLFRRIRILESFKFTNTKLDWIILTILPVLPPGLRPIGQLETGKMLISDINDLYCRIINAIKDVKLYIKSVYFIYFRHFSPLYYFRKKIQELIDSLIDNSRAYVKAESYNTPLSSFTEALEGKHGRFRNNILGKRVNYSGRTVITAEPSLRINECGLPLSMGLELFKPFLINRILKSITSSEKAGAYILNKKKPYVWVLIKKLMSKHCILLNRAPTLHKHGIQAFYPFISLDNAIHLHPLVCAGFNADFDGDQMAVHLPIYNSSQIESSLFMKPSSNSILQSNGDLILKPTQDIIIGNYYLTLMFKKNNFVSLNSFANEEKVLYAYFKKIINLHSRVLIRYSISKILLNICLNNLKILDNYNQLTEIQLIKFYKIFKSEANYYIITNFGILIARKKKNLYYLITDLFLETTAGRILFAQNLKHLLIS